MNAWIYIELDYISDFTRWKPTGATTKQSYFQFIYAISNFKSIFQLIISMLQKLFLQNKNKC
jgi:hypothetical protein